MSSGLCFGRSKISWLSEKMNRYLQAVNVLGCDVMCWWRPVLVRRGQAFDWDGGGEAGIRQMLLGLRMKGGESPSDWRSSAWCGVVVTSSVVLDPVAEVIVGRSVKMEISM